MLKFFKSLGAFNAAIAALMFVAPTAAYADECQALADAGQSKGLRFGKDAQRTTAIGAIAGGIIGGLLGRATAGKGDNRGRRTRNGALIGAGIGAAAGLSVGQTAERRREAFESESAYLDCEISNAEVMITKRNDELERAQEDFIDLQSRVREVNVKIEENRASGRDLRRARKRIDKQIEKYDEQLEVRQKEIDFLNSVRARTDAEAGGKLESVRDRRERVASQTATLQDQYSKLLGYRNESEVMRSGLGG